jgi:ribose transport system permease protein
MHSDKNNSTLDGNGKMEDLRKKLKLNMSTLWERIGVPVAIVVLAIFFGIINPKFFSFNNLINIGKQISFIGLVAWAQTMIIISAGIDLSVGTMTAFLSVVMATIIRNHSSSPSGVLIAILVCLLISLVVGVVKGFIIGKLNIPPFIATLGFMSIFAGGALTFTRGTTVFGLESDLFIEIGNGDIFGIPYSVLIMIAFLILTYVVLRKTRLGLFTYSIGGNEQATRWAGINIVKYKIYIYTSATFMVAIAAILMTSRVNSGQPLLGKGLELQSIAAVCIGGTSLFGGIGTVVGTLFGVILMGILRNGLNILGVSSFIQEMIIGVVILIAVFVSLQRRRGA